MGVNLLVFYAYRRLFRDIPLCFYAVLLNIANFFNFSVSSYLFML